MPTNRLFRAIGFVKKAAIKEASRPASLLLRARRKVSLSIAGSVRGPIGPTDANQTCQRSAPPPRGAGRPAPPLALPVSAETAGSGAKSCGRGGGATALEAARPRVASLWLVRLPWRRRRRRLPRCLPRALQPPPSGAAPFPTVRAGITSALRRAAWRSLGSDRSGG